MDECQKLATQEELDKVRAQVVEQKRIIDALLQRIQTLEQDKLDSLTKNNFIPYFSTIKQQAWDIIGEAEF